jgi:transposase-like protein
MTNLTDPIYTDADEARKHFERIYWPNGPVCSHCGVVNAATLVKGKSHRPGMYQCNACRKPFTVTTGSVMESSHIPLNKWALGFHLYAASKKGFSAHQLHRMIGVTYKSAWFMSHRIREAMGDNNAGPIGAGGATVEADETFIGRKAGQKKAKGGNVHKMAVVSLIERGGKARSVHVDRVNLGTIATVLSENLSPEAHLRTDELTAYRSLGHHFASHKSVNHNAAEYVRGDVHTNTAEGFFSIFKRGMKGVYQHCGEQHLHRYLKEFDFRYSNRMAVGVDDLLRTMRAIKGAQGKRLTYRQAGRKAA